MIGAAHETAGFGVRTSVAEGRPQDRDGRPPKPQPTHVVAEGIGELKDPRIGLVTITAVRISPDLREGTVYFSVFGSEKKKKASIDGLASARAVLQARLGRELRTKRTPHLTFEYDPSVEYGVRMTKLIDEIAPEADASEDQPDSDSDSH